jgi:hypothetical protein
MQEVVAVVAILAHRSLPAVLAVVVQVVTVMRCNPKMDLLIPVAVAVAKVLLVKRADPEVLVS